MSFFHKKLARGYQESQKDHEAILARELGPAFSAYRRRFQAAEAGSRPPHPLHLDLDVATVCQLGCPMCPASLGAGDNPFPGFGLFMDEEMFLEAIREAKELSVPSIRFGLSGEPLLVPDLDLWVAEAGGAGFLDLAVVTNGQLLDRQTSEKLARAGLTRLMVSVDAACGDTYGRLRPGGDFERLVANIEDFLEVRAELGGPLPILRLSFVQMRGNQAERDQFREKFSPLADYLAFQDYLDLTGRDESSSMVGPKGKMSGKSVFRCPDPLTRLAVHADGGLFPCCSDFGRLAPVGDLWRDGLEKAWNSGAALFLASREGRGSPSCQRCLRASGLIGSPGKIPDEPRNGPKGTFPAAAGNPPPLPLAAIMAAPGDNADFPGQSAWRPANEFSGH